MKHLVRTVLVTTVAAVASMPVQPAGAASRHACDSHGGVDSATSRIAGDDVLVSVTCRDGARRGPFRYPTGAPAGPCADHGGVAAATARPGAGVIEVIIYCNDGQSEGPYTYEIR